MDTDAPAQVCLRSRPSRPVGLNYKFQRLRERLRQAIASGELAGKLPGERLLARRFRANVKTLSKALTDLAAEGLLQRSIGRGTYVAGQLSAEPAHARWLVLAGEGSSPLVTELLKCNAESRCITLDQTLRPSAFGQCGVLINCARPLEEALYHDLMIRGVRVIETTRPDGHYSNHGVMLDRHLAAFNLTRELVLLGHVRLASVDVAGDTCVFDGMNWAAGRYGPEASVRPGMLQQVAEMISQGTTAFVCDGEDVARQILAMVEEQRKFMGVHGGIAVCGMGTGGEAAACTGYYVDPAEQAKVIAELAGTMQPHRPTVLWMAGTFQDRGTLVAPRKLSANLVL